MNIGPSGFVNTPCSKAILYIGAIANAVAVLYLNPMDFSYHFYNVVINIQFLRLLFPFLSLETPGSIVFAVYMFYIMRFFERSFGSRKFLGFIVIVNLYSVILASIVQIFLMPLSTLSIHLVGPIPTLFAFAYFYWKYIPYVRDIYLFNSTTIYFSEKQLMYILLFQISFISGSNSVFSALIGFISGILYSINPASVNQWINIPKTVAKSCDKYIGRVIASREAATISERVAHLRGIGNVPSDLPEPAIIPDHTEGFPEPSEDDVVLIMSMGFTRNQAIEALRQSGNNVESAINRLLDNRSTN